MNKNGLFISVIVNVLFRNFYLFLKILFTRLNINISSLEKLELLVKQCLFNQVLRYVSFGDIFEFKLLLSSFNENCNIKFYISNRVNNNSYAFFLYKKKNYHCFLKRFFCTSKKINREISKKYKLKATA